MSQCGTHVQPGCGTHAEAANMTMLRMYHTDMYGTAMYPVKCYIRMQLSKWCTFLCSHRIVLQGDTRRAYIRHATCTSKTCPVCILQLTIHKKTKRVRHSEVQDIERDSDSQKEGPLPFAKWRAGVQKQYLHSVLNITRSMQHEPENTERYKCDLSRAKRGLYYALETTRSCKTLQY